MSKPLVVVIGSNGQLGTDVVKSLQEKFVVKALTHKDIDITKKACYDSLVALNPDYVVNTAAFHNLKACEENPDQAFLVNAWGALNLAGACKNIGAVLVHISTDHVFDGEKDRPYVEDDITNPVNVYGKSKLLGEKLIRDCIDNYYILRVATLYGYTPPSGKLYNFIDFVVGKAFKKEKMDIVKFHYSSPTFTVNAANKLTNVLNRHLTYGPIPYGVYHCADMGITSFYDLAVQVCNYTGLLEGVEINPLALAPDGVVRAQYLPLEDTKLVNYGILSKHWKECVFEYLDNKYPGYTYKR